MVRKKEKKCCDWMSMIKSNKNECNCGNNSSGFIGRLMFVLGVFMAFNALGIAVNVSVWIKALIIIGFALMTFK